MLILISIITVILILCIILIIYKKRKYNKSIENFITKPLETFHFNIFDNKDLNINNIQKSIPYNNNLITATFGQTILFNVTCKIDNLNYIILRYPEFRSEIKRHSEEYFNNYFKFLKDKLNNKNYFILDFTGFHGILDNKVRLWISIYKKYGRDIANEIMGITYLCPNDFILFLTNYKNNKKYILKNSFGGARKSLKITKNKDEIIDQFEKNIEVNFNPITCVDSVCHNQVKYNIVQEFIDDIYLIKGHKIGLRMFLVITCINNFMNAYIFKDGYCYYSINKYDNNSININNNVVGSVFKTEDLKRKYKLPDTYLEFRSYAKDNIENGVNKIDIFEKKMQEYCKILIDSNANNLCTLRDIHNSKQFAIYAMDIEFNKNFKPYIYEANWYFTRFNMKKKLGYMISNLYNDIFYKLGLSSIEKTGMWQIY